MASSRTCPMPRTSCQPSSHFTLPGTRAELNAIREWFLEYVQHDNEMSLCEQRRCDWALLHLVLAYPDICSGHQVSDTP
jgi:hypothetical protein